VAAVIAALLLAAAVGVGLPSQKPPAISAIVVHGNQIVTDDEVLKIAGIAVGSPFTSTTIDEVTARLKASRKFESIEVLKRYASIDDFSQITLVINASEGSVRITNMLPGAGMLGEPQVVKGNKWRNLMGMVILDAEDGYGVTYGMRLAYPKVMGPRSRLSFPLTWGGTRKAGVELEKSFTSGPISRVEFGGGIQQRRNPAYDENDRRQRAWGRAEKMFGDFRAGGTAGWQRVNYAGLEEDFVSVGADATFDTRLDPILPRNAVYGMAAVEKLEFEGGNSTVRTRIDARGYLGLYGQQVLVARVIREDSTEPQPQYLRYLLGGWSNLRGFEPGFETGDTLVATSIEWRMPITSPLSFGKIGVNVFVDWGTVYEKGERFRDQTLHNGIGAGGWMAFGGLRVGVGVAHGRGAGTRVSFTGALTF
jgi:outer membrane protein assembly factor BamA